MEKEPRDDNHGNITITLAQLQWHREAAKDCGKCSHTRNKVGWYPAETELRISS